MTHETPKNGLVHNLQKTNSESCLDGIPGIIHSGILRLKKKLFVLFVKVAFGILSFALYSLLH